MNRRRWAAALASALLLSALGFFVAAQLAPIPVDIGAPSGRLAPCPPAPNCVSSQARPDSASYVAPLRFDDSPVAAVARLRLLLDEQPRTVVLDDDDDYLHVVFRSLLFRFPDDVEFVIGDGQIDMRSASRVGRGDFGVNRRRLERIRALFDGAPA